MFRTIYPSAWGGLVVSAVILASTIILSRLGSSLGEALYLSLLGLVVTGYVVTSWRLRRGK
jgi:hypothetical protein